MPTTSADTKALTILVELVDNLNAILQETAAEVEHVKRQRDELQRRNDNLQHPD